MEKTCDHPGRDQFDPNCVVCILWRKDPSYYAIGTHVPAAPGAPPGQACAHRGGPTGETVLCPSCAGSVRLKMFACAVHGTCTVSRRAVGVACCVECPDRSAGPPAPCARAVRG